DKVKAFAVGGVDYITKPFSEEEVFARVENNLTLRRLQQQLTEQNALLQQEIGNRQKAETALHLSQFYLDQLGDAVFFVNADARFVYVNQAACLHLGYSREQLLSMAVYDIDPNFPVANWESDWQKIRQKDSFTFESTHRTKDGREVIVEVNVNPREFNGQDYNLTVVRDITARKQAEAALLSSEVKFRHLFESAPVGIFSVRLSDGLLLEANQHFLQILGYTCAADAIAQKSMADFLLDPTAQQHILVAKQAAGKVCQYQTQIRKQDGGIISVLLALRIDAAKDCLIGAIALH
ncbi:MAG TPA: PAS domain S-box protein, partial [Leptolyngbyaceae cyanobacterium]